jgi:hypothetical protein
VLAGALTFAVLAVGFSSERPIVATTANSATIASGPTNFVAIFMVLSLSRKNRRAGCVCAPGCETNVDGRNGDVACCAGIVTVETSREI